MLVFENRSRKFLVELAKVLLIPFALMRLNFLGITSIILLKAKD
jgi:hypothetical protein